MPHIILECTSNLLEKDNLMPALEAMHNALAMIPTFRISQVKSRTFVHDNFRVGDGQTRMFAHVTLGIMPGRSVELQKQAGQAILDVMKDKFSKSYATEKCDLTVELREFREEVYFKISSFKVLD